MGMAPRHWVKPKRGTAGIKLRVYHQRGMLKEFLKINNRKMEVYFRRKLWMQEQWAKNIVTIKENLNTYWFHKTPIIIIFNTKGDKTDRTINYDI